MTISNGMNLATARQLRSIVMRAERLNDEIKALNADKAALYQEAKGNGFDTKALKRLVRNRQVDADSVREEDALYELYAEAFEMADTAGRTAAPRAPHDPTAGYTPSPPAAAAEEAPAAGPSVVDDADAVY